MLWAYIRAETGLGKPRYGKGCYRKRSRRDFGVNAICEAVRSGRGLGQRLIQISDDIGHILDADRQADDVRFRPRRLLLFR